MVAKHDTVRSHLARCEDVKVLPPLPGVTEIVAQVKPEVGDDVTLAVIVRDNGTVQFRSLKLATIERRTHRATAQRAALELNYQYKLAKFAIDPDDGEVVAYVDLVGVDSAPSRQQVERTIRMFRHVVPMVRRRCEQIDETGRDPGPEKGDVGSAEVERLMLELLREIETRVGKEEAGSSERGKPAAKTSGAQPALPKISIGNKGMFGKTGGLRGILERDHPDSNDR